MYSNFFGYNLVHVTDQVDTYFKLLITVKKRLQGFIFWVSLKALKTCQIGMNVALGFKIARIFPKGSKV